MNIGLTLDKALSVLAPVWARNRAAARVQFDRLMGYAADDRSRMRRDQVLAGASANQHIQPDASLRIARARKAKMDHPLAASLVRSSKRNVVGTGIIPIFAARRANGDPNVTYNQAMQRLLWWWAANPKFVDAEGKLSFWRMQRRAMGEVVEAGEHFIVMSYKPRKECVGLTLRGYEPEQLYTAETINRNTGNEIIGGIEIDKDGRAVNYYFKRGDDAFSTMRDPIVVPASRVCHIFDPDRVMQAHGVTRLHAVLNKISDHALYDEAELWAKRMEACYALSKRTNQTGNAGFGSIPGLNAPEGDSGLDAQGNAQIYFQPAMVLPDDYQLLNPSRPGNVYDPYMQVQASYIGAGAGTSYQQITRDFTRGTYSGLRTGVLEDRAEWDCDEQLIVETLIYPVITEFARLAVLEGRISAPGFDLHPERYHAYDYIGPKREWVDPAKESAATEKDLGMLRTTIKRAAAQGGYALSNVFEELAEIRAAAEAAGIDLSLVPPWSLAKNAGGAPPQPGQSGSASGEPDEPDEDEAEEQRREQVMEQRGRFAARMNGHHINGARN